MNESPEQVAHLIAGLSDEGRQAAVAEAVNGASPDNKRHVAKEAVRVAPFDAKKAAAAEAVESASPGEKKHVAREAVDRLSPEQQKEVANWFQPSQAITDEVWLTVVRAFKWVLWGATLALVAAVGVALFRKVDASLIQILLTVFTTVAGIFAGFISGKALSSTTGQ